MKDLWRRCCPSFANIKKSLEVWACLWTAAVKFSGGSLISQCQTRAVELHTAVVCLEHTHARTRQHQQIANAIHSIKNDATWLNVYSHAYITCVNAHTCRTKFLHQPPLASIDRAFACIILCFVTSSRPEYIIVIDHCWETNTLIDFVKCVLFILTVRSEPL